MGCLQDAWDEFSVRACLVVTLIIAVLGGALLLIVAGALTFNKQVNVNEYGVWVNHYNGDISDVKDQGAYTIPLGSKLYTFERVLTDSGLSDLTCLTADGIQADLQITVQYQYSRDEIVDIILLQFRSDSNFRAMISLLLTSAIQDACGQFTAIQYQTERTAVDTAMQNHCSWKLGNASLTTQVLVQLKNIALPDQYTSLVEQKQSIDQSATTALNQRQVDLVQANTTLFNAQLAAQIPLIDANQTATVNLLNAYAQGNYTYQQWVERTAGLLSVKQANGLNNTGLLSYLRSQIVAGSNGGLFAL